MASVSTLAAGVKSVIAVAILAATMILPSCSSPMDLDVDRTKVYTDGAVHPTRLTLYYYYGDSAYEAIVSDTAFLNTIWIERGTNPYTVTIPGLQFRLPDTVKGTPVYTPFVREFCFSSASKPCDGAFTMCQSPRSWLSGEYLASGKWLPFDWLADTQNRQIRLAYFQIPEENLIKGSIQINVADPTYPRYASYRVLLTMEY